jgi:hypothetical protein
MKSRFRFCFWPDMTVVGNGLAARFHEETVRVRDTRTGKIAKVKGTPSAASSSVAKRRFLQLATLEEEEPHLLCAFFPGTAWREGFNRRHGAFRCRIPKCLDPKEF